ncbi:type II toxin-antitoxin system HicB family antitoxin [Roseateles sp.]|uniref:type II toxin-antitoxin system HicB family antitoxin n=1 Tax=Roseateles sp. TaxID=1971397 RepID=UPI0031CFA1E4
MSLIKDMQMSAYAVLMIFDVVIEREPDSTVLVGSVPAVRGAYTQGGSTQEVLERLSEVLHLLASEGLVALDGGIEFRVSSLDT